MKTIGELIRDARERQFPKLNQSELAEELGLSRNQIANYENNRTPPPANLLEILARRWHLPPGYFDEAKALGASVVVPTTKKQLPQINLIPFWGSVPCGDWQSPGDDLDWIQVSEKIDPKGVVAVKVSGNSMAPRLMHGQTVIIKLDKTPREGVVTLAVNQHKELTLKVLKYVKGEWQLHSINPEHGTVKSETWEVLGYAIAIEEHDAQGIRP